MQKLKINIQLFGGRGASSSRAMTPLEKLAKDLGTQIIEGGIKSIQLTETTSEWRERFQKQEEQSERKNSNNSEITQNLLNNEPIEFVIYSRDGERVYTNIYENRAQMEKSIKKEYGGISQMVGTGKEKSIYSIKSATKKGEFYLVRKKFAKGGWSWQDNNGYDVNGYESRKIGSHRKKM